MKAVPSTEQLLKIALLSDTVLYREAIAFIQKFVRGEGGEPLPSSQINGLLGVAESSKYDELYRFVTHQRDRDWPPRKRFLKTFYTGLEELLSVMQRKRLREDFLLQSGERSNESRRESGELMALLAREFIQHLVAENGLLLAEIEDRRRQQRQPNNRQPGRR